MTKPSLETQLAVSTCSSDLQPQYKQCHYSQRCLQPCLEQPQEGSPLPDPQGITLHADSPSGMLAAALAVDVMLAAQRGTCR